jgi:hypothetical protein
VCAGGRWHGGQWMWTATLFCKNLPQTSCIKKKKNCISYSHERVYIFYLEVDATTSRATGGFDSLTTRFNLNHTVNGHQLCTFMEHNLKKLKIKLHFIPKFFSPITTLHISYEFCHVWWTWDVHYLLCIWDNFVVYR